MNGRTASVALAVATATAIGFTYAAQAPLVPPIAAELGLDDLGAGLIATALFLAASATMLVRGDVADRHPPKRAVTAGLVLAVAGNFGTALAPDYASLLLARAVGGIGAGIGFLGGLRYIAQRYGDERPHFGQGLYGGGFPLGSAIALWVMPALALPFGWRGAFYATSAAMTAVLLAWLITPAVPTLSRPGTMADAARCLNCWWSSAQHAAGFGLALAAGSWITVFLLREFRLPLGVSGLLGSLLLVLAVVARPVGGYLVARRHLGSLAVMRAAQLCVLAGIALLALPERPLAAAVLGAVAVGFGAGLPYAAVFNTAAASLRSAPSAAQGLTALGGMACVVAGAPAMGYAVQTWGFSAAWLLLGAISAGALLVTAVMRGEEDLA